MAATTAAVAVTAGAVVGSGLAQKRGAEKSAEALSKVGRTPVNARRIEQGVRALLGGSQDTKDEKAENRYKILQDESWRVASDQIQGKLSEATRSVLGRRAAEMGASLGQGVVEDLELGYLGLSTEQQVNEGFAKYRNMFGQLVDVWQNQRNAQYNAEYNQAAARASSIMGQANATAGMWQGVAALAGGLAAHSLKPPQAAPAATAAATTTATPAPAPTSWAARPVSQRPPGL